MIYRNMFTIQVNNNPVFFGGSKNGDEKPYGQADATNDYLVLENGEKYKYKRYQVKFGELFKFIYLALVLDEEINNHESAITSDFKNRVETTKKEINYISNILNAESSSNIQVQGDFS